VQQQEVLTMGTPIQVVMDCADPARLAAFWAIALGYEVQPPPEGFDSWEAFLGSVGVPESDWNSRSAVVDPGGEGPRLFFQRVPEPKTVKNRVHVDVNAGGGREVPDDERRARVASKVEELVAAGASVFKEFDQGGEHWVVMQDPEGNEFCVQ
jgi:glyoxalase superfamily protein